jgi:hypothetical protein
VLQEGEDLHTFCSRIVHYGISWTPSSMEQRTGRIDRIGSLIHRQLDNLERRARPDELLQVYYPYLADTVESLQVNRVFTRLNRYIRLLHRRFGSESYGSRVDTRAEFGHRPEAVVPITDRLESAFPVLRPFLRGRRRLAAVPDSHVRRLVEHFAKLTAELDEVIRIEWDPFEDVGERYGTTFLAARRLLGPTDGRPPGVDGVRRQPFSLFLRTGLPDSLTLLHGISPVGQVPRDHRVALALLERQTELDRAKICEVPDEDSDTYTVTVEGDLIFDPDLTQLEELIDLVKRVCCGADFVEAWRLEGLDQPLDVFRRDLQREPRHAAD